MIKIKNDDEVIGCCVSAILVPEKAMTEAGYIQMFTSKNDSSSKHEFHAMAQMAYYQYQDDELKIKSMNDDLVLEHEDTSTTLQKGMILCRDESGEFHVIIHEGLNKKRMLEAAFRYCTRWVRLDI